jgi:hypothetical protein
VRFHGCYDTPPTLYTFSFALLYSSFSLFLCVSEAHRRHLVSNEKPIKLWRRRKVVCFLLHCQDEQGPSNFSALINSLFHILYSFFFIFHSPIYFSPIFFLSYFVIFYFRFAFKLKFKFFSMFIYHNNCSCFKGFHHHLSIFLNFLWDPLSF